MPDFDKTRYMRSPCKTVEKMRVSL